MTCDVVHFRSSDCVKAYYKRAKAYAAVWSEKEAKRDFLMVSNLDVTLSRLVQKELKLLSERTKEKYWADKERYWNMLEEKGKNMEKKEDEEGLSEQSTLREPTQCPQQEDKEQKEEKNERAADQNAQASQEEPKSEASELIATLIEGKDRQQTLRIIMLLQDEASFHIKDQRYAEAKAKFKEALELVDYIQTKVSFTPALKQPLILVPVEKHSVFQARSIQNWKRSLKGFKITLLCVFLGSGL